MTTSNPAKLKIAQELVNRFRQAGRPVAIGKPPKKPTSQQLQALQASPSGWPVTRDALASQLTARLGGKEQPSQVGTSYCGPAAFLYSLLEDRPDLYVAYATSMWTKGEYDFGSLEIDGAPLLPGSTPRRSTSPLSRARWRGRTPPSRGCRRWPMPSSAEPRPLRPVRRSLWLGLGLLLVAIGFFGLFVPLLPTVDFLLLALPCFARSSPRLETWLLGHPRFGPAIHAWRERGAVPGHAKSAACVSMLISFALLLGFSQPRPWVAAAIGVTLLAVAAWLLRRPS